MINKIPIEVSNRHVHLSKEDKDKLFGKDFEFTKLRDLSQPGEFAAVESVEIINGNNTLPLRVLGPLREKTQIELSFTDVVKLKLTNVPLKLSSELGNCPEVKIAGLNGIITINQGIIIAKRHVHCSPEDAKNLNLKDKIDIFVSGERPIIFKDVPVRISAKSKLTLHLDRDEGNAAGLSMFGEGELI